MQKSKYILPTIIFLTVTLLLGSLYFKEKGRNCKAVSPSFINSNGEIHYKFLVLDDGGIVYSINDSNSFSLKIFRNGKNERLMPQNINAINPVLISKEISAMQDNNGNDEFKTTSSELTKYIGSNSIKTIYTFNLGYIVLVQFLNDDSVYLINLKNKTEKKIVEVAQNLNGVTFSENGNYLVISYDKKLICVDVASCITTELASSLEGEKLNPFMFDDCIYFVNNSISEYYQVYKINIIGATNYNVQPVFQAEHDILMPKIKANCLYFVEVINSEYILKRLNLSNGRLDRITDKGVVFNYEFNGKGEIVFVYSDLITPKCLMIYNESNKSLINISGTAIIHNVSCQFIKSNSGCSSAYVIKKVGNDIKGVVLFIHPGILSDFSPRWDPILMNICNNGYIIIAPNFLTSFGYGKSFYKATANQAIEDVIAWKQYILKSYNDAPLFCLSSSYGNILMENLLAQDTKGIKAAVSFFGIPTEIREKSFSVPTLYILGENDQIIGYYDRYFTLSEEKKVHSTITIVSYADEGHGFRKKKNIQDAITKMYYHFCLHAK